MIWFLQITNIIIAKSRIAENEKNFVQSFEAPIYICDRIKFIAPKTV